MLFNTTDEFLLSGRAEQVAAHCPGVNDRLQGQSRKQFGRVFWARRVSECQALGDTSAMSYRLATA